MPAPGTMPTTFQHEQSEPWSKHPNPSIWWIGQNDAAYADALLVLESVADSLVRRSSLDDWFEKCDRRRAAEVEEQ